VRFQNEECNILPRPSICYISINHLEVFLFFRSLPPSKGTTADDIYDWPFRCHVLANVTPNCVCLHIQWYVCLSLCRNWSENTPESKRMADIYTHHNFLFFVFYLCCVYVWWKEANDQALNKHIFYAFLWMNFVK
jgi:hypothetical protein